MNTSHQMLADTLDYLQQLAADNTKPEQALDRLRSLQARYPETRIDLLWEVEAYDSSVHYDTLLQRTGQGTISLSLSADRALPWPMRGAHRSSERTLLRVNQTRLDIDQAVACLDFIWDEARLVDRLVKACLLQEVFDQEPVELSDGELQAAMDAFRRARGLYGAEVTQAWMQRNSLTHDTLERLVRSEAMVAKLRERVTAGRVEPFFQARQADFDTAKLACFTVAGEQEAAAIAGRIAGGEIDFYSAAEAAFAAAPGAQQPAGGMFVTLRRGEASLELREAVFDAAPGTLAGPVPTPDGYAVVRVLSVEPARLDETTRRAVKQELFEAWLDERRQEASIEWYWGNAGRTQTV